MNDKEFLTMEELFYMMIVKNYIYCATEIDLVERFIGDKKSFAKFLEALLNLLKYEESFFLLDDDLSKKTGIFINKLRFSFSNEFNTEINKVILSLNELKSMGLILKIAKQKSYIQYQSYLRNIEMDESEISYLLKSLSTDSLVIESIEKNNFDDLKEKFFVLISLNYLINMLPEYFKLEPVKAIVEKELENIRKNSRLTDISLRRSLKYTKKILRDSE